MEALISFETSATDCPATQCHVLQEVDPFPYWLYLVVGNLLTYFSLSCLQSCCECLLVT